MTSPFAIVKEKFGDKAKLVAELEKFTKDELWVSRENKAKGLAHVSNAKLLRLYDTFTTVKERFGTRAKLVDAILELEKRAKDDGYKSRLLKYPVPRLWDMFKSTQKRLTGKTEASASKSNGGAAKPKAAKKSPESAGAKAAAPAKKAPAKKASAKKEAAAKA